MRDLRVNGLLVVHYSYEKFVREGLLLMTSVSYLAIHGRTMMYGIERQDHHDPEKLKEMLFFPRFAFGTSK